MEKSKIFLSWSGERSKKVAMILGRWLEDVLQTVDPFMSDTDIAAGDIWFDQIGANLEASRFAIICVTPENAHSRWLHFEAGAIGMTRGDGARGVVAPYLLGLGAADLSPPLSLFQAVPSDKQGTLRLVYAINSVLAVRLDSSRLERTFDRWWPDLERDLTSIPEPVDRAAESAERSDRELLEELLTHVRHHRLSPSPMPTTLADRDRRADHIRARLSTVLPPLGIYGWRWHDDADSGLVEVEDVLSRDVSPERVQGALDSVSDSTFRFVLIQRSGGGLAD